LNKPIFHFNKDIFLIYLKKGLIYPMMKIIKRDSTEVDFIRTKIEIAISKANKEVKPEQQISYETICNIANDIEKTCAKSQHALNVEDIQDMVETKLMEVGAFEISKKYIKYRYDHELRRKANTTDDKIMSLIECNNEEIKQENSNKNPTIVSVQRDYVAGEVSKDLTRRFLLDEDIIAAHDEGIIHFHDMDYFLEKMSNCSLVNLFDMLWNGTVISGTMIDRPHTFSTACNIATQIIAQVASSQFGGQSINMADLVKFVDISRQKIKADVEDELQISGGDISRLDEIVEKRLKKEIEKGVQTIQYQVVTLMTTNGLINKFGCYKTA
jgi:ribonucleoside-triphosphate reductase